MKIVTWDSGFLLDDPNTYWGDPSYQLEPGDPGYIPPSGQGGSQNAKSRKMKKNSYYPSRVAQQIIWLENFRNKLSLYGTTLGLDAGTVTSLIADARWLVYVLVSWLPAARASNKSCTDAATDAQTGAESTDPQTLPTFTAPAPPTGVVPVKTGALNRIFAAVQLMKDSGGYTVTIGTDLGTEGSGQTAPDLDLVRPAFDLSIVANQVFLDWKWDGLSSYVDMLEIQVDRGAGWQVLVFDTTPGYTDTMPFPASPTKWKYRAIWRLDDQQVGQWSEEKSINVG